MSQVRKSYDERSTATLIGDLINQISNLFRKEFALFRAETSEKLNQVFTALGLIIASVVAALTALIILASALVAGLVELGLAPGWSALIVGGGIALVALGLALKGINDLKASQLAPNKAVSSLEKDAELARGAVK